MKSPVKFMKKRAVIIKNYVFNHKKAVITTSITLLIALIAYRQITKPPKGITTETVRRGSLVNGFTANGEIKARKMADLKFYSPGKVSWIGVKNGDNVRAYQALASLDQVAANAAYSQAINNLRQHEASVSLVYDSLQGKSKTESFAERDMRTKVEVGKDNAYEQVKEARNALSHLALVSPIKGTVVETNGIIAGLNLSGADIESKFIKVVDLGSLYFEAQIDAVDFAKVKAKQKVNINLDSYPGQSCEGEVFYINKSGRKTLGGVVTYASEINLTKCDLDLGVNLNGQASFITNSKDNVLAVPKKYLVVKDGKNYVWKQVGKKPSEKELVAVSVGDSNSTSIEVIEGLSEGDTVVFTP